MISQHYTEGPWKGLTSLDLVLTPEESQNLQAVAATDDDWEKGRQEGGYFKLFLGGIDKDGGQSYEPYVNGFRDLRKRLSRAVAKFAGVPYAQVQTRHDFWLLFFPQDSFVAPHQDPVPKGHRHIRVNVAVTAAESGGRIVVPNGFYTDSILPVQLRPGQGLIFEPSAVKHSLERVYKGSQLFVSLGADIKE